MKEKEKIKLTGYTDNKGLVSYIILHIKKYKLLRELFIEDNVNLIEEILILFDFIICTIIYGSGINDYFQYNFWYKRYCERKKFIVARKWKKIVIKCNGKIEQDVFDNKSIFNQTFSDFITREWIDIEKSTYDEFIRFIERHDTFLSKIQIGSGGNGIRLYEKKEIIDTNLLFDEFRRKKVILEEVIKQHESLADFNPSSVNTLRVVTIVDNFGKVNVLNAVIRMGNGVKCTDNFHHHGLAALVDEKTGLVITPAIDKSNKKYYVHPKSKKQIVGYKVPFWERILAVVKEAALVEKQVRYVGWDIAINQKGQICIIEGNCASDPDITQMPDQIGKWKVYEKYIRE